MKTEQLVREFRKVAKGRGLDFTFERAGGRHDLYRCGAVTVANPRHGEIGPKMEFELRKELESVLGKRWWK